MLLSEFLKVHRKVQEQEAMIARLASTDAKQEAMIANQQKQQHLNNQPSRFIVVAAFCFAPHLPFFERLGLFASAAAIQPSAAALME